MAKYRLAYGAIALFTAVAFFVFPSRYMLVILGLEIVFPLVSQLLITREAKKMTVSVKTEKSCTVGSSCVINVTVESRVRFIGAAVLVCRVRMKNVLFNIVREEKLKINLSGKKGAAQLEQLFSLCGEVKLECVGMKCVGVLGISGKEISGRAETCIEVAPGDIAVEIERSEQNSGDTCGDRYYRAHRGADLSEIFDLREYREGDDIRMIHRKLSEKLDMEIVKEFGDPARLDYLLMLDAGLTAEGKSADVHLVSSAIEFFAAMSEKLVNVGIPHYVGFLSGSQLYMGNVSDRAGFVSARRQLFASPLPGKTGTVLKYFSIDERRKAFSKLIYVCADSYDPELDRTAEEYSVTAICVGSDKEITSVQERSCIIIRVPSTTVHEDTHKVIL